ncbi:hypothetical protein HZS_5148 [Henneguya salminicola]|nr:hypothetical protein HZS_5148 [Henneguya salminicola]
MNKKKLNLIIVFIWIFFILFSIITTPNWKNLLDTTKQTENISECVYSSIMEPYFGITSIIIIEK